jgi:hypothetical protein
MSVFVVIWRGLAFLSLVLGAPAAAPPANWQILGLRREGMEWWSDEMGNIEHPIPQSGTEHRMKEKRKAKRTE